MKFLKPVTSRFAMVTIALIMQIGFIVLLSNYFEHVAITANVTVRIIGFTVICIVLNQIKNPSIAMTWTVFILVTPIFGSVLYILIGSKSPARGMRKQLSKAKKKVYGKVMPQIGLNSAECDDEEINAKSSYLRKLGFPLYKNTTAEYFSLGDDAFGVMLEEIEKATDFIFMEYFILDKGEMLSKIEEALIRKASEGVDVRVIYDDMGCLFTLPHNYWKTLENKGVKCLAFNRYIPVISAIMNNRDHRKILVIDSRVAFTGGVNIADEYINKIEKYGHWKDNVLMVKGEAAMGFSLLFLELWKAFRTEKEDLSKFFKSHNYTSREGYFQPFSDSPVDDDLVGENIYMDAINNAKKYIYIFTPYLIPDQVLIRSLSLAAQKGVDVKILVPGIPDKKAVYSVTKSYYGPLIKSGVEIYKYTPGFLHSKGFVSDDNIALCGTINLDFRSLYHHFECGCVIYKAPVINHIKDDFLNTLEKSEKIEKYQRVKGVIGTTYHAVIRLLAPLM